MAFEIFDLSSVIHQHNKTSLVSPLNVNSAYGLKAFSPEFKDFLTSGIELYRQAYYLRKGFEGKRIHEYQSQLQNSRSLVALRKLVTERKRDGEVAKSFLLREERAKREPKLNEGFAHYTHDALLEAYDVLRMLENAIIYSLNEVKRTRFRLFRRVPSFVVGAYEQYVNNQLCFIQAEQKKLIRAVSERLVQASKDYSLEHGDVLYNLNPSGLVEDKLSQLHFQDFYNVIRVSRDRKAKKRLSTLPWAEMASQFSINPSLGNTSIIYHFAKLEVASYFLRAHQQKEFQTKEEIIHQFAVIDTVQLLIHHGQNMLAERKTYLSRWWRRLFNTKNLMRLRRIQHALQAEFDYVQEQRVVLQQDLARKNRSEEQIKEGEFFLDTEALERSDVPSQEYNAEVKMNGLESLLMDTVCSRFNLGQEGREYLNSLKNRMLELSIIDVNALPDITSTDRSFLGLYRRDYFSIFSFDDDRQLIGLTLNAMVRLNRQKQMLMKLTDPKEQAKHVQKSASAVHRYLEKYGTEKVQKIIQERREHV